MVSKRENALILDDNAELVVPSGYLDFDGLSELKEWLCCELRLKNGNLYRINFLTPARLQQDAEEELKKGLFYLEENLVLVPSVGVEVLKKAALSLVNSTRLKYLIPSPVKQSSGVEE